MTLITFINTKQAVFIAGDGRITKSPSGNDRVFYESYHKVFLTKANVGIAYMGGAGYLDEEECTPNVLKRFTENELSLDKEKKFIRSVHHHFSKSGYGMMNLTFLVAQYFRSKRLAYKFNLYKQRIKDFDGKITIKLIYDDITDISVDTYYFNYVGDGLEGEKHKRLLKSIFILSFKELTGQKYTPKRLNNLSDEHAEQLLIIFYQKVYENRDAKGDSIGGKIKILRLKENGPKWIREHDAIVSEVKNI